MSYKPTVPGVGGRNQCEVYFDIGGIGDAYKSSGTAKFAKRNFGTNCVKLEHKVMMNSGYEVNIVLIDPYYQTLGALVEAGYLKYSRSKALRVRFRISSAADMPDDRSFSTEYQICYVTALNGRNGIGDAAYIEIAAVDPATWELSKGDCSGRIYTGKVSSVIRQVVQEYAPSLELEISSTNDYENGKWGMMRQDPMTFVSSLLSWTSSLSSGKSQWLLMPDGGANFSDAPTLRILKQERYRPLHRANYQYWASEGNNSVVKWDLITNSALSLAHTKIITQGLSSISGEYLDRTNNDANESVIVRDLNTEKKKIADTKVTMSTSKPDDSKDFDPNADVGFTSINSIPEFNAGDLGINYKEYIDGIARSEYLRFVGSLMKLKLRVLGHGEWTTSEGLGADIVFIDWREQPDSDTANDNLYFLAGNWLIYGFHHIWDQKKWFTDLYLARYDWDSRSEKIGPSFIK
jgi:hypothetical protein